MYIGEIKKEARERFALNRYHAMLVYGVVYTLALNIAVLTTLLFLINKWAVWYGVVLIFLFVLMLAPFGFGMTGFYLKLYRFEKIDAFHIFDGFNKYNLERVIILRLFKLIPAFIYIALAAVPVIIYAVTSKINFIFLILWIVLIVAALVPGIIFAIRTSMATYLLRANPKLKPKDSLRVSNRVMKTHNIQYLGLVLSFTGWFLFGIITCGLGFIWVQPYFNSAKIVFYKRELQGDKTIYRNPADDERVAENKQASTVAAPVAAPVAASAQAKPAVNVNDEWSLIEAIPYEEDFEAEAAEQAANVQSAQNSTATESEKTDEAVHTVVLNAEETKTHTAADDKKDLSVKHERITPEVKQSNISADKSASIRPAATERISAERSIEANRVQPVKAAEAERERYTRPSAEGRQIPTVRIPEKQTEQRVMPPRTPQPESVQRTEGRADVRPLPGSKLTIDENGHRRIERPAEDATLPLSDKRVEIGENGEGESVRERLERLRAERNAAKEAAKKNVEINED